MKKNKINQNRGFTPTPKNFFGVSLQSKRGFSLVEVLVMVFIASFAIFVVWRVYVLFIKISLSNPARFQASFLAEEGIEAVKFMRDGGWASNIATLSSGTPYYLIFGGTKWEATTTPTGFIGGKFERKVTFSDVNRDASGNIADSGTFDSGTKKVSVEVSWWKDAATTTKIITTYVSNIFEN